MRFDVAAMTNGVANIELVARPHSSDFRKAIKAITFFRIPPAARSTSRLRVATAVVIFPFDN
jgi:hypothetical protein